MASNTTGTNLEIVDLETFDNNSNDLNESPVAKYLNVIASFAFAGIGSLMDVSDFDIDGSI